MINYEKLFSDMLRNKVYEPRQNHAVDSAQYYYHGTATGHQRGGKTQRQRLLISAYTRVEAVLRRDEARLATFEAVPAREKSLKPTSWHSDLLYYRKTVQKQRELLQNLKTIEIYCK